jgi:hypothetical protein
MMELTNKKLINLDTYMDAMNDTLKKLRKKLECEFSNSIGFWNDIVKKGQVP